MTILVVRPAPACDELVASLQQKHMKAIAAPLQTFSLGKQGEQWVKFCQAPTRQTAVVAVSPRAVHFADQILSSTKSTWPRNIHYIAVGKATADAFISHAKIHAQIPERQDSEGLYHCLNSQQKSFMKVVILRGNGGREFLGQQLCQNGVNVCYVEVYQRHWDSELAKAYLPHWQNQGVNTLVISSGEQLMQFVQCIPNASQSWFKHCRLFVPSERVYHQAKSLGFHLVHCVHGASNHHFLDALQKQYNSGING